MADYQNVPGTGDDLNTESVEVLRERLNTMKRLMSERTAQQQHLTVSSPKETEEIWSTKRHLSAGIIDGNFLSMAFGGALMVIVSVSIYAFYNLYNAILKKFPSRHEEL